MHGLVCILVLWFSRQMCTNHDKIMKQGYSIGNWIPSFGNLMADTNTHV